MKSLVTFLLITAKSYDVRFSQNASDLNAAFDDATAVTPDLFDNSTLDYLTPIEAGLEVKVILARNETLFPTDTTVFFAVRSKDESGNVSPLSNVARFVFSTWIPDPGNPPKDGALSGGEIAGIVIGTMAGIALCGGVGFFAWRKWMRK